MENIQHYVINFYCFLMPCGNPDLRELPCLKTILFGFDNWRKTLNGIEIDKGEGKNRDLFLIPYRPDLD